MLSQIEEHVSLAQFTTLKIGGRARFFLAAKHEKEIIEAVQFAEQNKLKFFILGGGSNVLIADEGFDGLVLQVALKGVSVFQKSDETVFVTAGAGEDWDEFVAFCVERNLQGVECLSGIPGFVGGTPVQNVGAYGQEVSETIVSVRVFDRKTKKILNLLNGQCAFAYRTSIFNTAEKDRYIILFVTYALKSGGEPKIVYRDLKNYFGDAKPNLQETRTAILTIRAEKSMVIDASDRNSQSAGSFFKNPIVTKGKLEEIEKRARRLEIDDVPYFKVDETHFKIPCAWLIEKSGFQKGFQFGKTGLSTKHTLAIINRGGATAADILSLMNEIQSKVKDRFDVEIKPEPIFVGFPKEIS
jgi:UDP-N-acetylmuramate dehydrogenase